ncbi:hypothetical protein NBO_304g0004 [Nosema bombycis CQ1]|uniref:DNA replication complex GINS protein PSF3 n=1 Tax=Nosema bombycis (strain CQ1 / CVCC 102059) TaxID=578461 RepID=R0KRV9_NOSB1|nr:hypothetical protein NBO_304g0004 [Nosema bombycis CQ1]|eukprot:EOB12937.1 hypothetical protein NBO_304g0004 [Nosema bombycis CQ1]
MDYYSIDEILTEETKLKVKFKHKINNFECYFSSDHDREIEADKKIELPYFLVKFLIENRHCEIVQDLITKEMVNELKAFPPSVDLNQIYNYFYRFLQNFNEKDFTKEMLKERLSKFSKMIIKENLNEDDIYFMDKSEKHVIQSGREAFLEYKKYY